jgi:hypothetical protein
MIREGPCRERHKLSFAVCSELVGSPRMRAYENDAANKIAESKGKVAERRTCHVQKAKGRSHRVKSRSRRLLGRDRQARHAATRHPASER